MSLKTHQQNFEKQDNGNEHFKIRLILHMLKTTSPIYTQVAIDVSILTQEPKYNVIKQNSNLLCYVLIRGNNIS